MTSLEGCNIATNVALLFGQFSNYMNVWPVSLSLSLSLSLTHTHTHTRTRTHALTHNVKDTGYNYAHTHTLLLPPHIAVPVFLQGIQS